MACVLILLSIWRFTSTLLIMLIKACERQFELHPKNDIMKFMVVSFYVTKLDLVLQGLLWLAKIEKGVEIFSKLYKNRNQKLDLDWQQLSHYSPGNEYYIWQHY